MFTETIRRDNVTMAEVAAYFEVSLMTVRRWIAAGDLPAYRVGKRNIRIRVEDVEKLKQAIGGAA